MPEAEVGFSAPEQPVVESRYNQLKGPWWYHRGTVDRGTECRGGSEERCLGEMGGGKVERLGGGILVVGLQPRGSPGLELDSRVAKTII